MALVSSFGRLAGAITGAGAFGVLAFNLCTYTVMPGYRGLIFNEFGLPFLGKKGVSSSVKSERIHFYIPILQRPILMDVRSTPKQIKSETQTKDAQNVRVNLRVLYRPDIEALPQLFSNIGKDYADRVLPSLGHEVSKAVMAQYDATELITQREVVSREIREVLKDRANKFNIELDDVSITGVAFSTQFTKAIELKQVEQQKAEKARFDVEKSEQERQANIIKAEGESEAARLITLATKEHGPALVELRRIEAAREIAETLAVSSNITYLPSSDASNVLLHVK